MRLENLVMQARDPRATGRFWSRALGLDDLTIGDSDYEGRLVVGRQPPVRHG